MLVEDCHASWISFISDLIHCLCVVASFSIYSFLFCSQDKTSAELVAFHPGSDINAERDSSTVNLFER